MIHKSLLYEHAASFSFPLIYTGLLCLVSKYQDGNSENAQLEASQKEFINWWVTSWHLLSTTSGSLSLMIFDDLKTYSSYLLIIATVCCGTLSVFHVMILKTIQSIQSLTVCGLHVIFLPPGAVHVHMGCGGKCSCLTNASMMKHSCSVNFHSKLCPNTLFHIFHYTENYFQACFVSSG